MNLEWLRKVVKLATNGNVTAIYGFDDYKLMSMATNAPSVKDLKPGQYGFTVPWAYDEETNTISDSCEIHARKGGTATLQVICEEVGKYKLVFHKD